MPAQAPSYSCPDSRAVAILGMSIAAPGGESAPRGLDTEAFYQFLQSRGSGIITVPTNRWNAEAFHGNAPGKICTTKGGYIPEYSYGDLQEFGITPAEAAQVQVTQTVLLHQAFNALQRSGIDHRGTKTGVYIGCAGGTSSSKMDSTMAGPYYMTGTSLSIAANRISYVFDLLGPSLPVDTACSSSLVAMHLAVQAIRNGECDQAVVAGANFIGGPLETIAFSQLGVLSPDGISKSFDEAGNGYARGDVVGAVVIKRHDLAVRDWDHIMATLVGTALTSCGNLMGSLTTPSPEAQAQAIRDAYRDAGLEPHDADFVELHGTGTVVGDSLEANAAGDVFAQGREGREILIGSVKSNVGHGEMGAYMSSLVKVVMMLERKQVLPNGYFQTPSSRIHFKEYNLRVPTAPEKFAPHSKVRGLIASISSFGFGGSCGHTVLREHEPRPQHPDVATAQSGPYLFAFGGLSLKATNTLVQRYREQYANVHPAALSAHLGARARQMTWRTFAVADSLGSATFPDPEIVGKRPNPLIYCFSGQGPQHWQQGRDLMATYSVFRDSILACDKVYKDYTGESCIEKTGLFVANPPASSPLAKSLVWPAEIISVAITFFQIAMFDLLTSLGLKPDAIVGHSIGETAVLYASGAMPRDMVVEIAIARGRALAKVDGTGGTMVALSGSDASTVQDHIDAAIALAETGCADGRNLYMAAFNSPTDIGVSGSEPLVDLLTQYVEMWVDGIAARKLRVSTAVHSPFVDPCEGSYRVELAKIFSKYKGPFAPTIPTMSTVTAEWKSDEYTIEYLWRNLRQPVLFSSAIPHIVDKFGENTTFVEISPHPVLSQYIKRMGGFDSLPCAARPPSVRQLKAGAMIPKEHQTLLQTLGQLLTFGTNSINFNVLNGCPSDRTQGPEYPFQMKFYSFAERERGYLECLLPPTRPLNATRLRVSPRLPEEWMSHHIIDHSNIIPAAAYIEMALEFPDVTQIWDVRFKEACILEENVPPVTLAVEKDGVNWTVKSSSALQTMQGDLEWTRAEPKFDVVHAYGKLGYGQPEFGPDSIVKVDVDEVLKRCISESSAEEMYAELLSVAQFGPEFKRLKKSCMNDTEAICWIKGHVDSLNSTDYVFHPALIDALLQTFVSWTMLFDRINVGERNKDYMLPHSLRHAYRNDGKTTPIILPEEFRTYIVLKEWTAYYSVIDAYVLADDNTVLFTMEGMRFASVNQGDDWPVERYMMHWQPRALPSTAMSGVVVLEGTDGASEAARILRLLDQLAIRFTQDNIRSLPHDFEVTLPDRGRYLAWAKKQAQACSSEFSLIIPVTLREKYSSLFELTERVGQSQQDIFIASTAAIEIMFRDDLMSKIYEHPPFVGPVFDKTVEQFISLVRSAILAGKRVVKVLEVGAGTGRLTSLLGQALIDAKLDQGCYVDYVSTDISISLAQESTAKSPWPTMTAVAFDLGVPLSEQNLDVSSFDIVVAFDVLHAVPDVHHTLTVLHELLVPGGHLAIIELDGNSFAKGAVGTIWMDFIFGSFTEWMGVLEQRPGSTHCSLSPVEWKSALNVTGFSDTMLITSTSNAISHIAFVSQASTVPVTITPSNTLLLSSSASGSSTPLISRNGLRSPADTALDLNVKIAAFTTSTSDLAVPVTLSGKSSPVPPGTDFLDGAVVGCAIVRAFSTGGEMALVQFLAELDSNVAHTIWLYTDVQEQNCTLIGLVRSIRQEFGLWKIMMALFHPSWDTARQEAFVRERLLPLKWVDAEVMVDADGNIHVPRIVAAPPPPHLECRGEAPIQFDESRIWRAFPECIGSEDVEISVSFISLTPAFPGCVEFAGVVTATGHDITPATLIGKSVFGIASSNLGSVIVCKRSQVTEIPETLHASTAAAIAGRLCLVSSVISKALPNFDNRSPQVLLHAGSWSPGAIATYNYLRSRSVDVFVTVEDQSGRLSDGTSEAFLVRQSTPPDVWSFHVREWATKGVDVAFVFDSNPDVMKETVQLLSNRGLLVQVAGDLPTALKRGQRYISVDYHALLEDADILTSARTFLDQSTAMFDHPPVHIFPLPQLCSAQAKSTSLSASGSIVLLDLQQPSPELPIYRGGFVKGSAVFDPRASYYVIGGIGGLGAQIARCLIENGARHVVLTSRSGPNAFDGNRLIREKKTISYLRDTPGVTIDVLAVDCLDSVKTKEMFAKTSRRIAGVFYLAVRLNDQLFLNLTTEDDWKKVYDVKVKGLKVLLDAVDPKSLDFLCLTSSMATVSGSPGQANYAAAQTEMEAIGASLPNTVSIAVPPITDGGVFVRSMPTGSGRNAALDKYTSLGMPGYQVAKNCVDAIWGMEFPLKHSLHIPSTDWQKVLELGSSGYTASTMRHLLVKSSLNLSSLSSSAEQTIRSACAAVLSMDVNDVEMNIPLSSYGLDSLTSVRLSGILKQSFNVVATQLQLLSRHMTVERLESMRGEQLSVPASGAVLAASDNKSAQEGSVENDLDQTVVRLNNVMEGAPLFMFHGAGGGILVLQKTAQQIQCPVYGVQDTPEAPLVGTIERLAQFYLAKIREKQPKGPYRFAGFSFGTCVAYVVSLILQSEGEKADLLVMLDGAPSLFSRPKFRAHIQSRIRDSSLFDDIMDVMSDMTSSGCLDGAEEVPSQFADHITKMGQGESGAPWVSRFCKAYAAHVLMGIRACASIPENPLNIGWPAQRTVLLRAERGMSAEPYAEGASWYYDLDLWTAASNVEVHELPGTHFGLLNPISGIGDVINKVIRNIQK